MEEYKKLTAWLLEAKHSYWPHVANFCKKHFRIFLIVLSGAMMLTYFGIIAIQVLDHALRFNGFAINGAFQALNPLRRLMDGQVIGRDFQYFHGIGIPLLHYPLFRLLGGDLSAAEIARWSLLPTLFGGSCFLFFWATTKRWWLTTLATSLTIFFCLWQLPGVVYPENSSLGLRSLSVVFVMIAILYRSKLQQNRLRWGGLNLYHFTVSLLLAIALMGGTEQGVAAVLSFTVVGLIFPSMLTWRQRFFELTKTLTLAGVWLIGLLTVISQGHPWKPIKYAFIDIPTDQAWYFGSPPNAFIHYGALGQVFTAPFNIKVGLATLTIVALLYGLRRQPFLHDRLEAFSFGIAAGTIALISMFGYYAPAQLIPLARMDLLIGVCLAMYAVCILGSSLGRRAWIVYTISGLCIGMLAIFLLSTAIQVTRNQFDIMSLTKQAYHRYIRHSDSENLGLGWQGTMALIMPIVNVDNGSTIMAVNDNGFVDGISTAQNAIRVQKDKFTVLLRPGQVVYLSATGRHRVASIVPSGNEATVYIERTKPIDIKDSNNKKVVIGERLDKTHPRVWSTYASLFETEMGTLSPTPGYDYVIHALGKNARKEYSTDLDKARPEYAITVRRDYSYFEEWVQYTSWDVYQRIVDNYSPVQLTGSHVLWQRIPNKAWVKPNYHADSKPLPFTSTRIDLPANYSAEPSLKVLTIQYQTTGLSTKLPVINKSPRYLLTPRLTVSGGAVSLPPYMSQWSFPVVLQPHSPKAYYDIAVYSLVPDAHLKIKSVSYQSQATNAATIQALLDKGGPLSPVKVSE